METMTVTASELKPGDFIDTTEQSHWRGGRGGKHYTKAYRVNSGVTAVEPHISNRGQSGLKVTTYAGSFFALPSTRCNIRRNTSQEA